MGTMKKLSFYWRLFINAEKLLTQSELMVQMFKGNAPLGQTAKTDELIQFIKCGRWDYV